jgi:orotate phosphoribosyltransferase
VNEAGWREVFERSGAILFGHFELTSGLHSDLYVQKARVLERPETAMALAREIVSWYQPAGIDVVVAPAVGAVPLGFAVALAAGARSIYAEREGGRMRLRRGFDLSPGERTLVVEDVVTTGRSAGEVLGVVQHSGADPLGVAALVDRSTRPVEFPLRAVLRIEAASWGARVCPWCQRGEALDAPGSRHLSESTG